MVYHISYDLNTPGKDYTALYDAIKSLGSWCHPVDSTWYVDTTLTAEAVRNQLDAVMDATDYVIVSRASASAAWRLPSPEVSDWLEQHLK